MRTIGDRLKALRGATSQAQIARELGMKQPQYARYESGASSPSADVLIKMCDVFLCSADDILGTHRGGSATARGDGAIAAAGSNIHIEVGKDDKPGEMKVCAKCPKVAALQETLASILQAAKSAAAKPPRKR